MSQLLTCPHCSRHHRVCEPVCPFCGGTLPDCKVAPSVMGPLGRMNRATLVAAGAALLGAAACETSITPVYGGAPVMTSQDASADAADQTQSKPSDAKTRDDGNPTENVKDANDAGAGGS